MKKEISIQIIQVIQSLLEIHNLNFPHHQNSCVFLKEKYSQLTDAILNDTENKKELIEWSRLFASRIVFEGINNKEILEQIDKLNISFS